MTTTAMDTLKAAHSIFADGIQYLGLCRELSLPALKAVMSDVAAAAHHRACQTFFRHTTYTRKQAAARRGAAESGHHLDTLLVLDNAFRRVRNQGEAWAMLIELCNTPGSTKQLRRLANKKVLELNRPAPPAEGVRVTRRKDGPSTFSVTGDPELVENLWASIKTISDVEALFSGGLNKQPKATHVVISLPDWVRILSGDGDEITLQLTNGTTMTGAEYVRQCLWDAGLGTLVDPRRGPVNQYRYQRHASSKQKDMAKAETTTCAWPNCRKPADECQVHHIHPWVDGGETNQENLTLLCEFHNSWNDDDPTYPRHGRVNRRNGKVTWDPPWGGGT
ncbi:HNH endonuclease signature motif containing protein [Corynebacterium sp. LK2590]|uniref:HNH endonuclease signature motif containing protein n=1 Tax=unclassified Corynebacterium TaxID=2624378 RepID=UPI0034CD9882